MNDKQTIWNMYGIRCHFCSIFNHFILKQILILWHELFFGHIFPLFMIIFILDFSLRTLAKKQS